MINICPPALIYLAFSLTQIIIDTFKGLYNTAFFKVIVMIIITILLNTLCQGGMSIISWIIVFIPFMFMSVIVGILFYVIRDIRNDTSLFIVIYVVTFFPLLFSQNFINNLREIKYINYRIILSLISSFSFIFFLS